MTRTHKHKEFLDKLYVRNSHYAGGDFQVVGEYVGAKSKIMLRDRYGLLRVSPSDLLSVKGVSINSAINKNTYYASKALEVHGHKYNYDLVEYTKNTDSVDIICPTHGVFSQNANSHLQGHGCPKCGQEKVGTHNRKKAVISTLRSINKDYNFSESVYINNRTPVEFICKHHGKQTSLLNALENGGGCKSCAKEKLNNHFSKQHYESKYKNMTLYIIKCYNVEEEFIKIGFTGRTLEKRFSNIKLMPYSYDVLHTIKDKSGAIYDLEKRLRSFIKNDLGVYRPRIKFCGHTECITLENYKKGGLTDMIDAYLIAESCRRYYSKV